MRLQQRPVMGPERRKQTVVDEAGADRRMRLRHRRVVSLCHAACREGAFAFGRSERVGASLLFGRQLWQKLERLSVDWPTLV
jgi:hypothetical protein